MRWLIGIDLRALSEGAVAFAHWLDAGAKEQEFHGVHIVETNRPRLVREHDPRESVEGFHNAAAKLLGDKLVDPLFARLEVREAAGAEDGLAELASEIDADAFIVGRLQPTRATHLPHLGRVARRMLRRLTRPTIVVPPDLRDIPDGKIVLATDLTPASSAAASFARRLALELDRPLEVVFARRAEDHLDVYLPRDDYVRVMAGAEAHARRGLEAWANEHDLGQATQTVLEGRPTFALLDQIRQAECSLLVTGSRGLSTLDRMFTSSTASRLAATAPIPIAVVPADWSDGARAATPPA